ncbi:hypothetical protein D3C81_376420 [compost metagenome]
MTSKAPSEMIAELGRLMVEQFAPAIPANVSAWRTTYENGSPRVAITWSATGWTFLVRTREQKGPVIENIPLLSFSMQHENDKPRMIQEHERPAFILAAMAELIEGLKKQEGELVGGGVPETPLTKPFVQGWFMAFFSINPKVRNQRFTTRRVYLSTDDNPDYQKDLLLDFNDHGENGIGVYTGFPCKQN